MTSHARTLGWIAAAVLLLAGLYVVLTPAVRDSGSAAGPAAHRSFELSIGPPDPAAGFPSFTAMQGDTITLAIRSDRPGEVNVHGYEKRVAIGPGEESALSFVVKDAGVFPVHLHELAGPDAHHGDIMHRHLATIEVQPR